MSIVKNQHYVWRRYLRPWADNDRIWTCLNGVKVVNSNLINVAQERYFYRLIDLTATEIAFLQNFIENNSPRIVKELNLGFLRIFTYTSKLKNRFDTMTEPVVGSEKYSEEIKRLEINLMEEGHAKIEALGYSLISCRRFEDLRNIVAGEHLFESIMFLCFQYVRTSNMRKYALDSFKGTSHEELAIKTFNILGYVIATTLAVNIAHDPNLKFIFHENNTSEHFITSDQPIFNILNDEMDENGNVKQLELYYPISPKHALTLHFRDDKTNKLVNDIANEEMIRYLNRKVLENSDFFVFAATKEQLERLF